MGRLCWRLICVCCVLLLHVVKTECNMRRCRVVVALPRSGASRLAGPQTCRQKQHGGGSMAAAV